MCLWNHEKIGWWIIINNFIWNMTHHTLHEVIWWKYYRFAFNRIVRYIHIPQIFLFNDQNFYRIMECFIAHFNVYLKLITWQLCRIERFRIVLCKWIWSFFGSVLITFKSRTIEFVLEASSQNHLLREMGFLERVSLHF